MNREEMQLKTMLLHIEAPQLTGAQKDRLNHLIAHEASQMAWMPHKPLAQRILEQAAYLSPRTWALQFMVLALGILFLLAGEEGVTAASLSAFIPLIGLIGVPELAKSFSNGMWELEESCFYNLRQVILLKMLLFGIVDGILLLTMIAAAGSQGTGAAEAFYYLAVPFNLSTACYLGLFHVLKRRCDGFVLAAAGILMVLAGLAAQRYGLFQITWFLRLAGQGCIWLVVAVSQALLAGMGYHLIHQFDKEEESLWNFESTA